MGKLTVRGIEAAKPKDCPFKLMDGDGLQLRVATDGVKTWLVRYVVQGVEKQYRLPRVYRDTGGEGYFTLQQARDEAARIRALARQGIDYAAQLIATAANNEEQAQRARQVAATELEVIRTANLTVQDLFDAWLRDGVRRKDGNAELRRSFNADVLPKIGARTVRELNEHHLREVLRTMVDRGVNRAAVMVRNSLTQMFAWARKRQPWRKLLIEGDPMELIEIEKIVSPDYDLTNVRDRILSDAEIVELRDAMARMRAEYDAAENQRTTMQPLEQTTECAIWIMLSTLVRVGELSMARWDEIDLETGKWLIPKKNVKGSLADLTIYLSPFAASAFSKLRTLSGHTDWCFPGRGVRTHMDVKGIAKQLGDRQAMFKKAKDGTARKPMRNRRHDNTLVLARGKSGAWTPHDLRRTGATLMQRLGVSLEIIDRCQNHVLPGSKVRRHYLHHDYADEKKTAWKLLGNHLTVILESGMHATRPATLPSA